ncbi:MAG: hypothetical protein U5L45_25300 [Saprospiraceae bacterium]|nr:hypothetical protein [Saprospiraceae bacterium]
MWFVFRRSRKTNHVSSLLRERSARKTSVFNQKTMFLGYAHFSIISFTQIIIKNDENLYLPRTFIGAVCNDTPFCTSTDFHRCLRNGRNFFCLRWLNQ